MRFAMSSRSQSSSGSEEESKVAKESALSKAHGRSNRLSRQSSAGGTTSTWNDYLDLNPPPRALNEHFPAISPVVSPTPSPSKAIGRSDAIQSTPEAHSTSAETSAIDFNAIQAEMDRMIRSRAAPFSSSLSSRTDRYQIESVLEARLTSLQDQVAGLRELVVALGQDGKPSSSSEGKELDEKLKVPPLAQEVGQRPSSGCADSS